MSAKWPKVKLGEALTERHEAPSPDALALGKVKIVEKIGFNTGRIKLRSDGETKTGMILIRPGDLVVSGINAAKGAIATYDKNNAEPIAATIHYGAYIPNPERVSIDFLWLMLRSRFFQELVLEYVPGGIKTELKAKRLLPIPVPLPPLTEQQRIVARIEELAGQISKTCALASEIESDSHALLNTAFDGIIKNVRWLPMSEAAPLVRRPVEVEHGEDYHELGVRSFGKGSFHKPALTGLEIGNKRLYRIEPGDLVFNNVFAWEGAVAVAKPEDAGRFGSHRFITCVPEKDVVTAEFLCFYFLTPEALQKLGEASPGGAGRNRTLGLEALSRIEVPVPAYKSQLWFNSLQSEVNALKHVHAENTAELDALLPSILDKAFKGEL